MLSFDQPTWTGRTPRDWQAKAFAAVAALLCGAAASVSGIIRAIMGSGKSVVIAELAACAEQQGREVVVVTTSSVLLVRQLRQTIAERVKGSKSVGCYYTERKDTEADILIACVPSVPELAERLQAMQRRVILWIADECHKTQCDTIIKAYETLAPQHSIGFTATPFRASHEETLSLFNQLIFDYGPSDALRDGVVVPWRIESWQGDDTPLDDACIQMVREAAGPGIVNASTIADAEAFAAKLVDAGIQADSIHSRHNAKVMTRKIEDLKSGALKCLVHVALLVEGADYPWLRWMCLRRNVDSRVRFLQEIGRCLRSHPGKAVAVFYDPNDLFGLHRISYEAALGAEPTVDELADEILDLPAERKAAALENLLDKDDAVALRAFEMELRRLVVACDAAGMCPDRPITKKSERQKKSTGIQVAMVRRYGVEATPFILDSWTRFFLLATNNAGRINKGAAADLCCILSSIADTKRFPPLSLDGQITAAIGQEASAVAVATPHLPTAAASRLPDPDRHGQLFLEFKN